MNFDYKTSFTMEERWVILCISIVSLFLFSLHGTESCGGQTHTEIAHQASMYFDGSSSTVDYKQLLEKHQDALQGGAPYPDAFYFGLCYSGKYHDISEDTHWMPFLNASINYIRRRYPQPWDQPTEKLVVFLFGLVSHQIADINWHSLGIEQGFLRTMANLNFYGNYDKAHTAGDYGGDVLNEYELNLGYIPLVKPWYIPVDDLVQIYHDLYGSDRMPARVIRDCSALLYIAKIGEKLAMKRLYPYYAAESPFLLDMLSSYFLGGMNDMAVWTDLTWRKTIFMLEHGTSACQWKHNPIFLSCNQSRELNGPAGVKEKKARNGYFIKPRLEDLKKEYINITKIDRGFLFSPSPLIKTIMDDVKKLPRFDNQNSALKYEGRSLTPDYIIGSSKDYSRSGWDMLTSDVNSDGFEDLIIGAPGSGSSGNAQQGAVYIILGNTNGIPQQDLMDPKTIKIYGKEKHGSFGQSVCLVDLNADGVPDLVAAAPSIGASQLLYQGVVYVFYGTGHKEHPFTDSASVQIKCQTVYCNLGWSLASGDLNKDGYTDLLIGSPFAASDEKHQQQGMIMVIYSKKKEQESSEVVYAEAAADVKIFGEKDYDWFGHQMAVQHTDDGQALLLIGAPQYRICALKNCSYSSDDKQAVGKMYIYRSPDFRNPALALVGKQSFGMFGSSFVIGHPYGKQAGTMLLVASTGADSDDESGDRLPPITQLGAVSVYNMSSPAADHVTTLYGDRRFSRFGLVTQLSDVNHDGRDDIIITAPLRTDDITQEISGAEEGEIFIYLMGSKSQTQADYVLKMSEERARLGHRLATVHLKNKIQIIASAPHSSKYSRLGGVVCIYNLISNKTSTNSLNL